MTGGYDDPVRFGPEDLLAGIPAVDDLGGISVSPDGSRVAFSLRMKRASQIYVSEIDDFKPVALTHGPGSRTHPRWSPDCGLIAFLGDTDGRERSNIFAVDPESGRVRQVTDFEGSYFRGFAWSPDGKRLAFSSDNDGPHSIYTIRSDGTGLKRLTEAAHLNILPVWSPDGSRLAYTAFSSGDAPCWIEIIDTGGNGLFSLEDNDLGYEARTWGSEGISVLCIEYSNGENSAPFGILDPDSGALTRIDALENEHAWKRRWAPDGESVVCSLGMGHSHVLHLCSGDGGMERVSPKDGIASNPTFTADGAKLLFVHEGPQNPSDLWRYSLDDGELHNLTHGLPDHVDPETLVVPEEIRYPSFDGMEIPAWLYTPQGVSAEGPPPAVIRVHGGPTYQSFNRWDPTIQTLVSHGCVVLAPNYRGSSGYGNDYMRLSRNDWGGGDRRDLVAAAEFLESEGLADGGRIALLGGSYGGYLMLMAMAKSPDVWAAGVCYYGFVDLEAFYRSTRDWIRQWIEFEIGSPKDNPDFYRRRSPINICSEIRAPLLFLQGANDPRITLEHSQMLGEKLRNSDVEFRLRVYGDEGHGFAKEENRVDAMGEVLDFLGRHLGIAEMRDAAGPGAAKG